MVKVWAIARIELVRLLRDRSNIFFVFIFPLLLVTLIGAQFGGSFDARLGVVVPPQDAEAAALVAALDATDGVTTVEVGSRTELDDEIARGLLVAGIVVEDGFAAALDAVDPVVVEFLGRSDGGSVGLRTVVASALAPRATAGSAAVVAAEITGGEASGLRDIALELQPEVATLEVTTATLGEDELAREFAGLGQFDLGASSQLFLFTFLTSLTGAAALIQARQLGVARRMVSTPTPVAVVVAGQAGGRFLIALVQAGYIVVATVLLFRVEWGDPLASGTVVLLFCLVAAAAGLVVGATFRNDSQAAGVGVGLGIGLAALGGSMVPLELFPPVMRIVAHVTPHAWANEAMAAIVRRDAVLMDVVPQVAALAGFAAVLLTFGTWQLRRVLTR